MSRAEFPKRVKLAAFRRAMGRCEGCGGLLTFGKFAYDHRNPSEFSGDNSLENCQCLCVGCHGAKTALKDIPAIAKSNRIRLTAAGIRRGSRDPSVAEFFRGDRAQAGAAGSGMNPHLQGLLISGSVLVILLVVLLFVMGCAVPLR